MKNASMYVNLFSFLNILSMLIFNVPFESLDRIAVSAFTMPLLYYSLNMQYVILLFFCVRSAGDNMRGTTRGTTSKMYNVYTMCVCVRSGQIFFNFILNFDIITMKLFVKCRAG